MRIVMFYHSLVSDWNHGNAHFLRGIVTELMYRGHQVSVYEPENGWSLTNLLQEKGEIALATFRKTFPLLQSTFYRLDTLNLDRTLADADLVIVHEWNKHELVKLIGEHRIQTGNYRLLFHDTHHRSASDAGSMAAYDLSGFDGVLAYGTVIRDIYLDRRWIQKAWVWHEAADHRVFYPRKTRKMEGDVVWVGNWGDDERTEEIEEFLIKPVKNLALKGTVYGVRYPEKAIRRLNSAGIRYGGWLPNFEVPHVFSGHRLTVHIPRRPYATSLPGIPTIRPFEALACGIPLISAPWEDRDKLFNSGEDFLFARDSSEMIALMRLLLDNPDRAAKMAAHGRSTVLGHHTCAHRVDQLLGIYAELCSEDRNRTTRCTLQYR